MRDPKRAVLFLQNLHRELIGILDSGVTLLMDNGITDWYVFVYADHSASREQVDALLADWVRHIRAATHISGTGISVRTDTARTAGYRVFRNAISAVLSPGDSSSPNS
jgi:hypothetical protein